jgi:division protein CdvB (Snf7/Vps24/ESCRT-III family)
MGFVYFVMTKFADLFMGNETQIDYDYDYEMNGVLDDVYDYESIIDDDKWFYGYLV